MMTLPKPLKLIGAPPSPYTQKMIAVLRYRQIPHNIIWGDPNNILDQMNIEKPSPSLLPTFLFPNKSGNIEAVTDSTPIIRRLENEVAERSVIPDDPALKFINFLLEDFGDEWVTKYMFHYRWHLKEDAENAAKLLPLNNNVTLTEEIWKKFKDYIGPRQIERLWVVGSNETTAPIIESSYKRFLGIMEEYFASLPFLLGYRPSSSDFAIYGQLTQLIGFDPTSRKIAHEISPRTVAWVNTMEDQSGLNPKEQDWLELESLPNALEALLSEIGRVYVPALLANSRALENKDETWETKIDDCQWRQKTFNYQGKCLRWIKEEYRSLRKNDQEKISSIFEGTGCELLLQ